MKRWTQLAIRATVLATIALGAPGTLAGATDWGAEAAAGSKLDDAHLKSYARGIVRQQFVETTNNAKGDGIPQASVAAGFHVMLFEFGVATLCAADQSPLHAVLPQGGRQFIESPFLLWQPYTNPGSDAATRALYWRESAAFPPDKGVQKIQEGNVFPHEEGALLVRLRNPGEFVSSPTGNLEAALVVRGPQSGTFSLRITGCLSWETYEKIQSITSMDSNAVPQSRSPTAFLSPEKSYRRMVAGYMRQMADAVYTYDAFYGRLPLTLKDLSDYIGKKNDAAWAPGTERLYNIVLEEAKAVPLPWTRPVNQ